MKLETKEVFQRTLQGPLGCPLPTWLFIVELSFFPGLLEFTLWQDCKRMDSPVPLRFLKQFLAKISKVKGAANQPILPDQSLPQTFIALSAWFDPTKATIQNTMIHITRCQSGGYRHFHFLKSNLCFKIHLTSQPWSHPQGLKNNGLMAHCLRAFARMWTQYRVSVSTLDLYPLDPISISLSSRHDKQKCLQIFLLKRQNTVVESPWSVWICGHHNIIVSNTKSGAYHAFFAFSKLITQFWRNSNCSPKYSLKWINLSSLPPYIFQKLLFILPISPEVSPFYRCSPQIQTCKVLFFTFGEEVLLSVFF